MDYENVKGDWTEKDALILLKKSHGNEAILKTCLITG